MRGVLGRMTAGAAGRILDSANPRDNSLTEGCAIAAKTRVTREHNLLSGNRGNLCVKDYR